MAVQLQIRVQGVEELSRKLRQINPALNDRWLKTSLRESGLRVKRDASDIQIAKGGILARGVKATVLPTRLTNRTGFLRNSIGVSFSGPRAVDIGATAPYAAVHEKGIPPYPKRPFLVPALEKLEKNGTIKRVFETHYRRVVES